MLIRLLSDSPKQNWSYLTSSQQLKGYSGLISRSGKDSLKVIQFDSSPILNKFKLN